METPPLRTSFLGPSHIEGGTLQSPIVAYPNHPYASPSIEAILEVNQVDTYILLAAKGEKLAN